MPHKGFQIIQAWEHARDYLGTEECIVVQPGHFQMQYRGRVDVDVEYPEESWVQVIKQLPYQCIINTVGTHEFELARRIAAKARSGTYIIGDWSWEQLAALLRQVKMLVSIDTGPAHLASLVGCPQVLITKRDHKDPRFSRPAYSPAPVEVVHIEDPPATVLAAVNKVLTRG